MDLVQLIILAIVQGITEFLPVSSSGHLIAVGELLAALGRAPLQDQLTVNVLLHAGTLGAILIFYGGEIRRVLGKDRRVIGPIIVGTIPIGVVGVSIKKLLPDATGDWIETHLLESPVVAGVMFLATAALLIFSARRKPGEVEFPDVGYGAALLIGCVQSLAILPGLSRSGATIAAGLLLGLSRKAAATFSFFLAIPAIAGATAVELVDVFDASGTSAAANNPLELSIATLVAFVVGMGALILLVRLVLSGKLHYFAWYLVPLGVAMLVWKLPELLG
ncbi:MAG: undecaprenyl-diphosphate phosphatase [Planctomycetota bacterium]|nr:MAG: undecaprenyl-diphosphate phosphatase [Planctomycetota bacterium]REK26272.1 MAG: undecaprenyl-diphosphate phosphatase [Planctomycetota bacterium]